MHFKDYDMTKFNPSIFFWLHLSKLYNDFQLLASVLVSTSIRFSVPSVKSASTSLILSALSKFVSTFLSFSGPSFKTSVLFSVYQKCQYIVSECLSLSVKNRNVSTFFYLVVLEPLVLIRAGVN